MDADILRLILFLAGIALIIGIYLWDRHQKINVRINAVHKTESRQREALHESPPDEPRQEPVWQEGEAEQPAADIDTEPQSGIDETLRELGELVQEEGVTKRTAQAGEQTAFEFGSIRQTGAQNRAPEQRAPVPTKIIQINVMGRHNDIRGDELMRAARDLQLEAGEMEIFHRYDEQRNQATVLFSMASMVEPGTFPFDAMDEFNTPGITLFAQLPGARDGLEIFDLLHETAQRLAALLDGELLDASRSAMSKQTVKHLREEISEHGRLVRLARSH